MHQLAQLITVTVLGGAEGRAEGWGVRKARGREGGRAPAGHHHSPEGNIRRPMEPVAKPRLQTEETLGAQGSDGMRPGV